MNKSRRIEYMLITLLVFISAGVIFGSAYGASVSGPIEDAELALMVEQGAVEPFMSEWKIGLLAGYMFCSVASALMLFARFFSSRRLWFKLLAAFFWPVTLWCGMVVGWFGLIPYWVYNLIRIVIDKPRETGEENHEN